MATDKKHIAVYLSPEVEQALITFCREKSLISKKGTMFSAGVNAALAQFFGIANTRASNTPSEIHNIPQDIGNILITDNIPVNASNIPGKSLGNILITDNIPVNASNILGKSLGNIPSESLAMEGLPGKF
jgi:hypothetical protein